MQDFRSPASVPSQKQRLVVRARAPLRLGLAGGGTDVSPYCDEYGGAVLNITIPRFAYAYVERRADGIVEFIASDLDLREEYEAGDTASARQLALHRGVYERMMRDYFGGERIPMTLTTHADAPAGSGLGTSSALVVALVDAFREMFDLPLGRYDVAHIAYEIERIDLKLAGGRQDQYAAAFGGANYIEFLANDVVIVNPLRINQAYVDELEASMLTCFTGQSRVSSKIITEQSSNMAEKRGDVIDALHSLKADAQYMKLALQTGNIRLVAEIMERSWLAKKRTASSISNKEIEDLYDFAIANGAIAGKVSGAGGGGFVVFVAHPEARPRLIRKLNEQGAQAQAVQFTDRGCEAWMRPY
ncbi:dehydrogenase [Sphingopyxis kveilinensis]|uniref:GHMP family kinase ATP-binding protein n=1 Tax=Sphingopyxis kveilinensis TaxID=3114367 RepID=UPI0030CE1E31